MAWRHSTEGGRGRRLAVQTIALAKTVLPHFGAALKCWAHVERERQVTQSFARALDAISTAVFAAGTTQPVIVATRAHVGKLAVKSLEVGFDPTDPAR